MPAKMFEWEYIRDVVFEAGEYEVNEPVGSMVPGGWVPMRAIFRSERDGKFYEFRYEMVPGRGVYSFDDWALDEGVLCSEVRKEVISIEKWLRVADAVVDFQDKKGGV